MFLLAKTGAPNPLSRSAIANGNLLTGVVRAVVPQAPRSHFRGLAAGHADDHVAVPGPSMLAVILAWARGMIGMRMIPAHDVQFLLPRRFLRIAHILGGNGKTVVRGIVSPVDEREQRRDFPHRQLYAAGGRAIAIHSIPSQERSAAFVRVRFGTVLPNLLRNFGAHLQSW